MFQYACGRALAITLSKQLKVNVDTFDDYRTTRHGFELDRVFGMKVNISGQRELREFIGRIQSLRSVRRILTSKYFSPFVGRRFICEPHFNYWPGLEHRARFGGYVHGYWQSERYFLKHAAQIRSDFTFRQNLSESNLQIAHAIDQHAAISIHVRRGDFVNDANARIVNGTCTPEYYHAAIGIMFQRCANAKLFFFSDDPQWVSQVLQPRYPNSVVVNNNSGNESYNDMRLISMCRHHIIANSSFSWWGAWLNPRPDKIVITPARWFANGPNTADLIPKGWERL